MAWPHGTTKQPEEYGTYAFWLCAYLLLSGSITTRASYA